MSDTFDDASLLSERERDQAAEIDRLTALLGETNDALAACQSEAGPALRDAARYRWIRQHNKVGGKVTVELECDPPELCTCEVGHKPHELDAAIDAAMTADQPTVMQDDEADSLLRALGLDPERFRTECGFLNVPKVVAALKHPADYAGLYLKVRPPHPCIHSECPEPHWCSVEGRCLGPEWKASNERMLKTTADKSGASE